jgi:hypothetical protein
MASSPATGVARMESSCGVGGHGCVAACLAVEPAIESGADHGPVMVDQRRRRLSPRSDAGLQDEVEGRLGRAPEVGEPCLREHVAQARLASLRAEAETDLLRE